MVCNEKSTISDPESSKGNDTPAIGFFVAYHLVRQGTVGAGWKLWVRKGLSRRQIRVGSLSTALHLSGNSPSSGQDRQTDRQKENPLLLHERSFRMANKLADLSQSTT